MLSYFISIRPHLGSLYVFMSLSELACGISRFKGFQSRISRLDDFFIPLADILSDSAHPLFYFVTRGYTHSSNPNKGDSHIGGAVFSLVGTEYKPPFATHTHILFPN